MGNYLFSMGVQGFGFMAQGLGPRDGFKNLSKGA